MLVIPIGSKGDRQIIVSIFTIILKDLPDVRTFPLSRLHMHDHILRRVFLNIYYVAKLKASVTGHIYFQANRIQLYKDNDIIIYSLFNLDLPIRLVIDIIADFHRDTAFLVDAGGLTSLLRTIIMQIYS